MLILFRNLGLLIGLVSSQHWMLVSGHHQRHARYNSVAAAQRFYDRPAATLRNPPRAFLDKQKRDAALLRQLPPHAVLLQDMQVQSGSSRAWGSP